MTPSIMVLLFLVGTCYSTVQIYEYDKYGVQVTTPLEADAGNFQVFPNDLTSNAQSQFNATQNKAKSKGDGAAFAGNRMYFGGQVAVTNAEFDINEVSIGNSATATDERTVSGSRFVFNKIDSGSDVFKTSDVQGNKATVKDSGATPTSSPIAISGAQTLVTSLTDSAFANNVSASGNSANNKDSGDAVSGVENALGSIAGSSVKLNNYVEDNSAKTKDGVATSGAETGINSITDSSIQINSEALSNNAKSSGGNAVSGVSNSINTITGSSPGGGAFVDIAGVASNNSAIAKNGGTAISGNQVNIGSATRAKIDINSESIFNKAVTKGTSDKSGDAVSGVQAVVSDIEGSALNVQAVTANNTATNKLNSTNDPLDNDAISGVLLTVGNAKDSIIAVVADSQNNKATAKNGDAIAGNKVEIGQTDSDTIVAVKLSSSGNSATSKNGTAIVDNNVTIGGDALTIGLP